MNKSYDTVEYKKKINGSTTYQYDTNGQLVGSSFTQENLNFMVLKSARATAVTFAYKQRLKRGPRLKALPYYIAKSIEVGRFDAINFIAGSQQRYQRLLTGYIYHPYPPGGATPIFADRLVSSESAKAYWYVTDDFMLPPSITSDVQRCSDLATTKLLLRMKDGKFNGAQALAEANQVQRLIGDTTRKLALTLTFLRKGNLRGASLVLGVRTGKREQTRYTKMYQKAGDKASIENMLSSGVLAVQYGIRPLLQDIVGAAELYAQKRAAEVVVSMKASATVERNLSSKKQVTSSFNADGVYTAKANSFTNRVTTVTVGCSFQKGSEVVHTLKQLGISNPFLLAWELMPWSFVIDWFIPIGNYLSSLDATLGLIFNDGFKSTKCVQTHTRSQVVSGYVRSSGSSTYAGSDFRRTALTGFPSVRPPQFKNPFSWEHALNGIALLVGVKNQVIKSNFR